MVKNQEAPSKNILGKSIIRKHQLWHWYKLGTIWDNLHEYFFERIPNYPFTKPWGITLMPSKRSVIVKFQDYFTRKKMIITPRRGKKRTKKMRQRIRWWRLEMDQRNLANPSTTLKTWWRPGEEHNILTTTERGKRGRRARGPRTFKVLYRRKPEKDATVSKTEVRKG
ncbi:uncharacterized protein LOC142330229 [Lycorma delicatula]|uniref:uncharacterized protein LOC142330229 n=1 Tax=Lycorma delicatula TaxID=130591 RepID=UPI003F51A127